MPGSPRSRILPRPPWPIRPAMGVLVLLLGWATGAAAQTSPSPSPEVPPMTCKSEAWLGRVIAQPGAPQGADAIDPATLPQPWRIVPQGGAMTMDFVPERLTLIVDDDHRVVAARCG